MINAKEARQRAEEVNFRREEEEAKEIFKEIERCADEGSFSTSIEVRSLTPEMKNFLISEGFTVEKIETVVPLIPFYMIRW